MAATNERAGEAERREPPRDEAARARAYLDLWERHLTQSAIDGPIQPGPRSPA
jgi:hypothetical protein